MKAVNPIPIILLVALAGGCSSPWKSNYQANPAYRDEHFAPTDSVDVRTVEYERVRQYAEHERQLRARSTTSPADYSPAERLAARKRLLEALQVSVPPEDITVLGWSEFTDTVRLDPYSKDLRDFAKSIGADMVVETSVYQGPVTTIVQQPVTTYAHGYTFGPVTRQGRAQTFDYADYSTTWVPMPVTEDQYFYQAFFLRRRASSGAS